MHMYLDVHTLYTMHTCIRPCHANPENVFFFKGAKELNQASVYPQSLCGAGEAIPRAFSGEAEKHPKAPDWA